MEDHKNCNRLGRKPMPADVKKRLAAQAKEYNEYKAAEKNLIDREYSNLVETQLKALDSVIFLPDYLFEEATSDSGAQASEDMYEFQPSVLYMEQFMNMFPPETTHRLRLIPAFEESYMRLAEQEGEGNKWSLKLSKCFTSQWPLILTLSMLFNLTDVTWSLYLSVRLLTSNECHSMN